MHTSAVIASAITLASSALAAPAPAPPPTPYFWEIVNYSGGASPATSAYSFDIHGPAYEPNVPGFDTHCNWAQINEDGYQDCEPLSDGRSVKSKLVYVPTADGTITYNVFVQYSFQDGEYLYTYQGNDTVGASDPSQPATFTIAASLAPPVA